jgi:hypothetical protein
VTGGGGADASDEQADGLGEVDDRGVEWLAIGHTRY